MAQKLVHKRSNQALKAPTGATLDYGEIAVNYNVESPFLSIKNSDNTYSKFSSDDIIAAGMVEYVTGELKGYSVTGHTHDDRYYTETEINTKLAGKSDTGHTHKKLEITDFAHTHKKSEITDFAHTHGTVTLTGDVEGSANFTNTGTSITVTVKDDSHTHDGRYYTETEVDAKIKAVNDTIANRYGFSNVKVGTTTLAADSITDTVEFKAGDNIVLSAAENTDTVTVGVKSGVFAPISHDHDYSEIKNTPTSLKNPNAITFTTGATTVGSYDGSTTAAIKIPSSTTHLTNDSGWITVADKVNSAKVADSVAWANVSDKVNATTATTGIVKLVEGDMNGKTHADGQAPSLNHTHSQYAPKSHTHGTIKLQGDVTGSASFTNAGATIDATVANDSHTHGSTSITGKITAGTGITDGATGLVDGNAVYEYAQPKGNYQAAGNYAPKEHSHTITATANDDDVVVLTGTNGSNAVTYTASHATQGPSTTGNTATTDTTTAQSPTHGGKIELNIPKITVNKYGHVTELSNQAVAVTLPSDNNTHYTTRIYAGASGTASNAAASNPYLKVTDDNTYRNQVRFVGAGATTVASDSAGTITITSPAETYKKHEDTSTLNGSYGTTSTNGSHAVKQVTVDALGHVTGIITGTTPDTKYSFSNGDVTLKWGTKSTIANVGGTDITVTMPANPDTDTHFISRNIVGSSSTAATNAAATNGNVWLNHTEEGVVKSSHNIKGAGATTVTSDSAGTITISSTDTKYESLKNPYSLTIQKNGSTIATYDGSTAKTANIIVPTKISDITNDLKSLTVGSKTYNGSAAVTITASDLGLAAALKYCGVTTTALSDGATTNPIKINNADHTATQGCVVFYGDKEFVFNGSAWELLGAEVTYKVVQSAVSSPNANGNTTAFIDTISQDTNGVISVTKKNVDFSAYQPKGNYKTVQTAKSDPTASGAGTTFIASITQDTNGVITASKKSVDFSAYQPKGNYKTTQTAVSSPNASGNATAFIDTITQNANGVISVTKKNVDFSAYVNQNAFSNVKVGTTTVAADSTTDTLTLVAGTNVQISADTNNDTITISASHSHSQYLTSHQAIYNLTMSAGTFAAVTFDPNAEAKTVYIPTHTSHITNNSGYITSAATVNNANNLGGVAASSYATQTWVNNKNYITSAATVAAANKLAAKKRLWGQEFDGSDHISGHIVNAGTITPEADATYEIGTTTRKYKTVHVSNNVNVGGSSISYNATTGCLEIIC